MLTAKEYVDLFMNEDITESSKEYVKDMVKQEAEKYLLSLAAISLDITPEVEMSCCDHTLYSEIKELHAVKEDLFYDLGEVKVQFKYPTLKMEEDAVEQFLDCIDYVVIDNQKYSWKEADLEVMDKLTDYFSFEFMQEVLNKLNADIYAPVSFHCDKCDTKHDKVIVGFNNLIEYYKL